MIALIRFVLAILGSPFKSKSWLEAENAALRQQLIVLRRRMKDRARFTNADRCFLSSCIRRSSRSSQSYVLRRWCAGIGPAFVVIGVGNQGSKGDGRRYRRNCVR